MPRQPSVTNLGHRESRLPRRSGQRQERSVGGRITVARGPAPPGSAPGRSFSGRAKGLAIHPSGSSESFTIRRCGGASRRPKARKTSSPTPGGTCTGFRPGERPTRHPGRGRPPAAPSPASPGVQSRSWHPLPHIAGEGGPSSQPGWVGAASMFFSISAILADWAASPVPFLT